MASGDILQELAELDQMVSDMVEAPVETPDADVVDQPPIVAATTVQEEPTSPSPDKPTADRPAIMPATGSILEDISGALDLVLLGMHSRIVKSGIQEQTDQLGIISMVMASLRKVKEQTDKLLGKE